MQGYFTQYNTTMRNKESHIMSHELIKTIRNSFPTTPTTTPTTPTTPSKFSQQLYKTLAPKPLNRL